MKQIGLVIHMRRNLGQFHGFCFMKQLGAQDYQRAQAIVKMMKDTRVIFSFQTVQVPWSHLKPGLPRPIP